MDEKNFKLKIYSNFNSGNSSLAWRPSLPEGFLHPSPAFSEQLQKDICPETAINCEGKSSVLEGPTKIDGRLWAEDPKILGPNELPDERIEIHGKTQVVLWPGPIVDPNKEGRPR